VITITPNPNVTGPEGPAGSGISWLGAWDVYVSYDTLDAVEHEGSSYVANAPSSGDPPPSASWDLLAAEGDPATATLDRVGASTYSTIQHMQDIFHSAGHFAGGEVTDNGDGTVDVASGSGFIRATTNPLLSLKFFDWAAVTNQSVPDNSVRYVGVVYNAGAPIVDIRAADTWDHQTEFALAVVAREGSKIHVSFNPVQVADHASKMIKRDYETMPFERDMRIAPGIIVSETGTRNLALSAGALWDRLNRFDIAALDTSVADTFDLYYRNGAGGYTKVAGQTQWPNTQYDNGTGTLATLQGGKFGTLWVYVETDGDLIVQFGRAQHDNLASAQAEAIPGDAPNRLTSTGRLIARLIFQKSAAALSSVTSAFAGEELVAAGPQGATGATGGFTLPYTFSTTLTAPPSTGQVRFDSATFGSVTHVFVHETDRNGNDLAAVLAEIPVGSQIEVFHEGDVHACYFAVTAIEDAGAYVDFTVTPLAGTVPGNGDAVGLGYAPKGDSGSPVLGIEFVIDGGGSELTTGVKGYLEVPYGCTINRVTLLADQSGSVVVDIYKDTYANFPPVAEDKITASAPPTISSAAKSQDSTLAGWTTSIAAGDILAYDVTSATTITRVTVSLKVTRT
jgi:hypothetical protein